MAGNIYDLSNQVEMDLDQYEQEEISEIEIKQIRRHVRTHAPKHKGRKKIAAAAVILCLGVGMLFNNEVYAFVEQVGYKISSIWELRDVEKYVNVINTSRQDQGFTITLNEVILDNDELIICQTVKGDAKMADYTLATGSLKIDGKRVDAGGSGGGEMVDEYTLEEIFYYSLSGNQLSLEGSHEIEYSITELSRFSGIERDDIKGDWTFRFTVTGDELRKDTVTADMDDRIALTDGLTVIFDRYSANLVNQKIYFHLEDINEEFGHDMELRGHDDLGNPVVFYMSQYRMGDGIFKVDTSENGYINQDAKRLELSLYIAKWPEDSGRSNSVYELAGEGMAGETSGPKIVIDIVK